MKVLVIGAGGQLGRALVTTAPTGLACVALGREALDLEQDSDSITAILDSQAPEVIINAAAWTAVDAAEDEPDRAMQVNATAPGALARWCTAHGSRLIHVSTDFVFDGEAGRPYAPDSPARPLGAYGRSKWEGECRVREALGDKALIVRTAWVYGAGGRNFVRTMLRLMGTRDEVNVVADQVGAPTHTRSLARLLWQAVTKPEAGGTLHWTDAGVASWFDLAVAVYEEGRALGLLDRDVAIGPLRTVDYPTPATRPAYSVLDTTATPRVLGLAPRHWRVELREMLAEEGAMAEAGHA